MAALQERDILLLKARVIVSIKDSKYSKLTASHFNQKEKMTLYDIILHFQFCSNQKPRRTKLSPQKHIDSGYNKKIRNCLFDHCTARLI